MSKQTEKLREKIARRIAWGWAFDKPDEVADFRWSLVGEAQQNNAYKEADQILKACKEAGLKFVDSKEMDSWDTLWIKEIEL